MNDTSPQGLGVCLFLVGATLAAAGVALGGSLLIVSLVGLAIIGVSAMVFKKARLMSVE